ncbi:MAG: APC family permease [Gammaproteobacteria bacterium]|nr:APC family permease [Gammaproteobacteria bacterium]
MAFYGLGNILGAGIYVLVGKVVGVAGGHAPLAFLVASLAAAFTAFSYAELSGRYPVSAGEAVYLQEGFGSPALAGLAGLLIAAAGMISAATIARGFAGYFRVFFPVPEALVIFAIIGLLGLLAFWGIRQSLQVAAVITVLEIVGLLLVVAIGAPEVQLERLPLAASVFDPAIWPAVLLAAFLAFYAFIGFEDMVNVAEEVRNPERNLALAIFFALGLATILYVAVALVAVTVVDLQQLAQSDAPLALVVTTAGSDPRPISAIGAFAVLNGALVQIIMASRLLYGMARRGWLPAPLGWVHATRHTPHVATAGVAVVIALLAVSFPTEGLAAATSYVVLSVFALVNAALLRLKSRSPTPAGVLRAPAGTAWLGMASALALLGARLWWG